MDGKGIEVEYESPHYDDKNPFCSVCVIPSNVFGDGEDRVVLSSIRRLYSFNITKGEFEFYEEQASLFYCVRYCSQLNQIVYTNYDGQLIFRSLPDFKFANIVDLGFKNTVLWRLLVLESLDHVIISSTKGLLFKVDLRSPASGGISSLLFQRKESIEVICQLRTIPDIIAFSGGDYCRDGGTDFRIIFMNFRTEKIVRVIPNSQKNTIRCLGTYICPYSQKERLISGSSDQTICTYSIDDGQLLQVLKTPERVNSMLFFSDVGVGIIGGALASTRGRVIIENRKQLREMRIPNNKMTQPNIMMVPYGGFLYSFDIVEQKIERFWPSDLDVHGDEVDSIDKHGGEVIWDMSWFDQDSHFSDLHFTENEIELDESSSGDMKRFVVVTNNRRILSFHLGRDFRYFKKRRNEMVRDQFSRIVFVMEQNEQSVVEIKCLNGSINVPKILLTLESRN